MCGMKLTTDDFFHDDSFHLKVIERDPELPYSLHSHDFFELVVIVSGTGLHCYEHAEYPVVAGNVFAIAPGTEHGYRHVHQLRLYNILFDRSVLNESWSDLKNMSGLHALLNIEPNYRTEQGLSSLMHLEPSQMAHVLALIETMQQECDSPENDTGSHSLATACFIQLLVYLFRLYSAFPRKDNLPIIRLADAFGYLEAHLDKTVTIEELMEVAHMSASTLNRNFKRATGCSPIEFLIQTRIEQACRLIRTSTWSMARIAEATGFSDANYFSRQFRKTMGISPKQYRCAR
jgi:AraC-like DNA-binding protein